MQFLYKTVLNINSKFIRLKLIFMTLKINKKLTSRHNMKCPSLCLKHCFYLYNSKFEPIHHFKNRYIYKVYFILAKFLCFLFH